jgi:hypothetical protein
MVALELIQVHRPAMIRQFLILSAFALLGACAPTTPETRIEASPAKFWKLSDEDQELVRKGEIRRGMSPDAVYYAWGKPAREFVGADEDATTMRWDYAGSTPVYSSGFTGYYGGGYGRYGRYYPRYGYAYSPQVAYAPYRRASVWFRNNRVDQWESAN